MRYFFFLWLSLCAMNMGAVSMDTDSDDKDYKAVTPSRTLSKLNPTQPGSHHPYTFSTKTDFTLEGDFCLLQSSLEDLSCVSIAHNYRPPKETTSFVSSVVAGFLTDVASLLSTPDENTLLAAYKREHDRITPQVINVEHAYLGALPGAKILFSETREISVVPEGWTPLWSNHRTFFVIPVSLDDSNKYYRFYNQESNTYLGVLQPYQTSKPFLAGLPDREDTHENTCFCLTPCTPSTEAIPPSQQNGSKTRIYATKITSSEK